MPGCHLPLRKQNNFIPKGSRKWCHLVIVWISCYYLLGINYLPGVGNYGRFGLFVLVNAVLIVVFRINGSQVGASKSSRVYCIWRDSDPNEYRVIWTVAFHAVDDGPAAELIGEINRTAGINTDIKFFEAKVTVANELYWWGFGSEHRNLGWKWIYM